MSTGAECYFTEAEPGRWAYSLQRWPYGDSDDYDSFGPFGSFAAANAHLRNNHANPGGYSVRTHADHRHEFGPRGGHVAVGFTVEIEVESLGPNATPAEVFELVRSLPADHPAINVRPLTRWRDDVIACDSCGARP